MTNLTLSQQGLALLLLDNEISNNYTEVRRWQRRLDEAQQCLNEAKARLTKNQTLLMELQNTISKSDLPYDYGHGYNVSR